MDLKVTAYENFPRQAMDIRTEVFIEEQGFHDEFDETDETAVHFVMYDGEIPVATCRVFWSDEKNSFCLGRLAVIRAYRGKQLGARMVEEAGAFVKKRGGKGLILHAQCAAKAFYEKCGYEEFGEVEEEQGCPHIWMRKVF